MTLTFEPFEQVAAEIATTVAIRTNATSTDQLLARAQVAQAVAGIFQTASTGDLGGAGQQLQTLLTQKISDPGEAKVVTDLTNIGNTFLVAEGAALATTPIVGQSVEAVLGSIAAGMSSVAQSYITKYTPATTAAAA